MERAAEEKIQLDYKALKKCIAHLMILQRHALRLVNHHFNQAIRDQNGRQKLSLVISDQLGEDHYTLGLNFVIWRFERNMQRLGGLFAYDLETSEKIFDFIFSQFKRFHCLSLCLRNSIHDDWDYQILSDGDQEASHIPSIIKKLSVLPNSHLYVHSQRKINAEDKCNLDLHWHLIKNQSLCLHSLTIDCHTKRNQSDIVWSIVAKCRSLKWFVFSPHSSDDVFRFPPEFKLIGASNTRKMKMIYDEHIGLIAMYEFLLSIAVVEEDQDAGPTGEEIHASIWFHSRVATFDISSSFGQEFDSVRAADSPSDFVPQTAEETFAKNFVWCLEHGCNISVSAVRVDGLEEFKFIKLISFWLDISDKYKQSVDIDLEYRTYYERNFVGDFDDDDALDFALQFLANREEYRGLQILGIPQQNHQITLHVKDAQLRISIRRFFRLADTTSRTHTANHCIIA